ncbi:MAG TPA: VCBS repeat-containing protein [Cyclobacteriaceae bacterium]
MKNKVLYFVLSGFVVTLLNSCHKKADTLFVMKDADETGVHFTNAIEETDSFNILTYEYIYNGGGVAVSDFNNDGLQDLFFTGNEVENKLYLNKGNLQFRDVTNEAHVNVKGRWNSGVAVADINKDGLMDIYVCATMKKDSASRYNMLFINKGLNKDGVPEFADMALQYGVAFGGYSINASFLDYDKDGDLDLYILTNVRVSNQPTNYRPKITDGSSPNNDKLYRNNGNNTFTDVTKDSGINVEGFGLGISVADFNMDGWPDIYVSNDYLSNDNLFINNKNGTFTNRIAEFIGHQSQFSMGNDVADINNDGLPDIITLDMLPEINSRKKTTISNKSYLNYINNEKYNYEYQYVRNMVHLNNNLGKGIKFSEIGELLGVHQTEWSWSPLFVDIDNDGNRDLLITNGFPKDISDKDFANYRADVGHIAGIRYIMDSIPIVSIPNYAYKNNGDLTFKDVTVAWGLNTPSFSNGAAFADLDNDGDLDYLINNINSPASIYENQLTNSEKEGAANDHHFIRVKLNGTEENRQALGAKINLYYGNGKMQYAEQSLSRGFLSSVEDIIHFGLGKETTIDSLIVQWPDGKSTVLKNVKADEVLHIDEKIEGKSTTIRVMSTQGRTLFEEASAATKIMFKHQEEDQIDFNLQRTLPHKFSQAGPGICVGDINSDGLEDFIIGGSKDNYTTTFVQKKDGTFSTVNNLIPEKVKSEEDEGLLLFDADNDGDLDLYIVSGSIEPGISYDIYQDRLYINNGKGVFKADPSALPDTKSSGSCARAADYDADGDLDLFVAGRIVPGSYPMPAESYLLKNDHGKFTNVTEAVCAELKTPGMITDAIWSDFDSDGKVDLILAGEFMSVDFYKNEGQKFRKLSNTGLQNERGWWNSITAGDYDKDGDIDYVVGNLGLNNSYRCSKQYPLKVFAKDFDGNNSVDPIMACYQRESMQDTVKKLYPIHFWDELNSQSPKFRQKFNNYKHYGKSTITDVLSEEDLKDATVLEANNMATSYVENLGNGKFRMTALPLLVQVSMVNGMITDDVNNDGNLDVMMIGNDYGNEVFTGRYDAFTGLVLLGNGKGTFTVTSSANSGFYVKGDAKALAHLYNSRQEEIFLATQNRDSLKVFMPRENFKTNLLVLQPLDAWLEFIYQDGKKERAEAYYGSGYLSQSSRKIKIPSGVKEIIIYDSQGKSRKIIPTVI